MFCNICIENQQLIKMSEYKVVPFSAHITRNDTTETVARQWQIALGLLETTLL
jgi:hypothetical protein